MKVKKLWQILKGTDEEFFEDRALRLSAALAYYAIFSIGPLLFVTIFVAGLVFGEKAVTGEVHRQLEGYVGPQAAGTVESMMAARHLGGNLLTTIIGIVTLVFGASGVFGQLQDSLNTIWEVQPKPGKGLWNFIRTRFLSLAMVLGLGFLLLISMVLTTALDALVHAGAQVFPMPNFVTSAIAVIVSFVAVTLLFALIFKVLPDVVVRWRDALAGAAFTAVLFTAGKYLLSMYLGQEGTSSSYGAAGSVIVILLWIYYASLILFVGAEFTQVFAAQTGSRIVPAPYAEPITEDARAQQGIPRQPHTESAAAGGKPAAPVPAMQPVPQVQVVPQLRPRAWPSVAAALSLGVLLGWAWKAATGRGASHQSPRLVCQ